MTEAVPTPQSPPRRGARRSQEQRSARTREQLVWATIDCLARNGFHDATGTRIVRGAGLSRGALTHHFPSHRDLVTAAVQHLSEVRIEVAARELRDICAGGTLEQLLDLLWRLHQGPLFAATIELWVAARADRQLSGQLCALEHQVQVVVKDIAVQLTPDGTSPIPVQGWIFTAVESIQGLLVANPPHGRTLESEQWNRVRTHLLRTAQHSLADQSTAAHSASFDRCCRR
ncbi:TetR/AcrR family transcriptional regulator [Nocardia sp. NPDC052001]|uniref:TetR/AcrR family transcriptional regulator n=1 Tax=Nocardia sp. NPDC052001 TaxID=3154853 RepID=UPI003428AE4E